MLQLKHLKLLHEMTGADYKEIHATKFGLESTFTSTAEINLAVQVIPANMSLVILRTVAFMVNSDEADTDYQYYRLIPSGFAYWYLSVSGVDVTHVWTTPLADPHLVTNSDELLIFPPGYFAALSYGAQTAPPATGQWRIQTTVYGYFMPPEYANRLAPSQDRIQLP